MAFHAKFGSLMREWKTFWLITIMLILIWVRRTGDPIVGPRGRAFIYTLF